MKHIFILLIFIFSLNQTYAQELPLLEYKIEMKDFYKDEHKTKCNIYTDVKNLTLDKKEDEKLKFKEREEFKQYVKVNCDTKVDHVVLTIYENRKKIKEIKTYRNTKISYTPKYSAVNFDIESEKNQCTIKYDGIEKEFKVSKREQITQLYRDKISLSCENNYDILKVKHNKINKTIDFESVYLNQSSFTYKEDLKQNKYKYQVYVMDFFDNKIKCEIQVDKDKKKSKTLNRTSNNKIIWEGLSYSQIKINCDKPIKHIIFEVENLFSELVLPDKIFSDTQEIILNLDGLNKQYEDKLKTKVIKVKKPKFSYELTPYLIWLISIEK